MSSFRNGLGFSRLHSARVVQAQLASLLADLYLQTNSALETVAQNAVLSAILGGKSGSTYSIVGGGGQFAISGSNLVRGATALDFDTADDLGNGLRGYSVTIRETNNAYDPSTHDTTLTFYVTAESVVTPITKPALSAATVPETATIGTTVGTLTLASGVSIVSMTDTATGRFVLDGNAIDTASSISADGGSTQTVSIEFAKSGAANATFNYDISVTAVANGDAAFVTPDFNSANFDETASTITDAATSTPTVRFLPKLGGSADYNNKYANIYGRVSGMNGKTATIEIDGADRNGGARPAGSNWGIVWRYLGESRHDWKEFDTQTESGDITQGVNNAAFNQDIVEVAFKPRYTEADYGTAWGEFAQLTYATEPPSSVAASGLPAYVHAEVSPGTITTNQVPASPAPLRSLKISEPGSTPTDGLAKKNIVIMTGQHSGEDQGDYFTEQFVERLNEETALAQEMRRDFNFYIYNVNPLGRKYGRHRITEESNGDEDANREWESTGVSLQVDAVKSAILADTGGEGVFMIDAHGTTLRSTTAPLEFFVETGSTLANSFANRVDAKRQTDIITGTNTGRSRNWFEANHPGGGVTLELADGAPGYPDAVAMYDPIITPIMQTFSDMRAAGEFGSITGGATGFPAGYQNFYDFTDAATLAANIDGTGAVADAGPIGAISDKGAAGVDLVAPGNTADRPTYLAEGAADFTGGAGKILYSRNSSVNPFADATVNGWTMAVAMRYRAAGTQKLFGFDQNPNGSEFWGAYLDVGGRVSMFIRDATNTEQLSRNTYFNNGSGMELVDGTEYVLVFTCNGSSITLYIDKVAAPFSKVVDFTTNPTTFNTIGLGQTTSSSFSSSDPGESILHQYLYYPTLLSQENRDSLADEMATAQGRTL